MKKIWMGLPLGMVLMGCVACSSQPTVMSVEEVKDMVLIAQCPALDLIESHASAMVDAVNGDMGDYRDSAREIAGVNRQGITLFEASYDRLPDDLVSPMGSVVTVKKGLVAHMEEISEAQSFADIPKAMDTEADKRWENLNERIGITDIVSECDNAGYTSDRLNDAVAELSD